MRAAVSIANQNPVPGSDIPVAAKFLLASAGDRMHARELAKSAGATDRMVHLLTKAPIGAGHSSDGNYGEVLADWRIAASGFFASLRTRSAYFAMLAGGFQKAPLRTRLGLVTANATGYIVGAGKAIPLSKLTLSGQTLTPALAAAIVVVTDEISRSNDPAATSVINTALRSAVADTVDDHFWSLVIDTATPSSVSAGNDASAMREDIRVLLTAVNVTGDGKLFWVMDPGTANRATLLDDARAAMTPLGGELFGLPAIVSSVVPAGTLRLVNAAAVAANADEVELDASREATVEMSSNPTNAADVPTAAELTSLFQTNSTALMARVSFAAERIRDDAVAEVTGISWGDET